jgi:hypothetical protein
LHALQKFVRECGFSSLFLDDLLIFRNSKEAAVRDTMTGINHLSALGSSSMANARPHLNLHKDKVWEPHIYFLIFEAWFTIARNRLLGATNVYHMSLYIPHSQSKPVGSRAKTSFLVMKEFNAESCSFFQRKLRSGFCLD